MPSAETHDVVDVVGQPTTGEKVWQIAGVGEPAATSTARPLSAVLIGPVQVEASALDLGAGRLDRGWPTLAPLMAGFIDLM